MGVLYLLSEGSSARKDGPRIVVEKDKKIVGRMAIRSVDGVVISKNAHVSTHVIFGLIENKVPIIYIDDYDKIVGHIQNTNQSVNRLMRQINVFQDRAIELSKEIIAEKINNQYSLLKQYAKSRKVEDINIAAQKLKKTLEKLSKAKDVQEILGVEGMASKYYFNTFPYILDQSIWNWKGRSQHPGKDPINALLNYGYAFLEREVRIAILLSGMDARIGFYHSNDGRKDSLVFDLMELFRQPVIDRFVLSLANIKSFQPKDFQKTKEECRLTDEGRLSWYARYEEYITKPYKDYDNNNSREMIVERVRKFAAYIDNKK